MPWNAVGRRILSGKLTNPKSHCRAAAPNGWTTDRHTRSFSCKEKLSMPRKLDRTPIQCEFFSWRIFQRNSVWYADGRRGEHNLGKHSLNTRDRDEALTNLHRLDRKKAIELDLATPVLDQGNGQDISIQQGWQMFLDHCN